MAEVHVVRDERPRRDYDAGAPEPDSEHTNATEAELAAEVRDSQRVVIHDRYHRRHEAARSPAGASARERLERTRRLARVRERARELARATR